MIGPAFTWLPCYTDICASNFTGFSPEQITALQRGVWPCCSLSSQVCVVAIMIGAAIAAFTLLPFLVYQLWQTFELSRHAARTLQKKKEPAALASYLQDNGFDNKVLATVTTPEFGGVRNIEDFESLPTDALVQAGVPLARASIYARSKYKWTAQD